MPPLVNYGSSDEEEEEDTDPQVNVRLKYLVPQKDRGHY